MNDSNVRYAKSFKEVYVWIDDLTEDLYLKIPNSFIELIKENMDDKYDVTMDELRQNGKMQETIDIMALVYRDYLCDGETKKRLQQEEEQELHDTYFNMFEKQEVPEKVTEEKAEMTDLVVQEEKWYVRIWNKIKFYFMRN